MSLTFETNSFKTLNIFQDTLQNGIASINNLPFFWSGWVVQVVRLWIKTYRNLFGDETNRFHPTVLVSFSKKPTTWAFTSVPGAFQLHLVDHLSAAQEGWRAAQQGGLAPQKTDAGGATHLMTSAAKTFFGKWLKIWEKCGKMEGWKCSLQETAPVSCKTQGSTQPLRASTQAFEPHVLYTHDTCRFDRLTTWHRRHKPTRLSMAVTHIAKKYLKWTTLIKTLLATSQSAPRLCTSTGIWGTWDASCEKMQIVSLFTKDLCAICRNTDNLNQSDQTNQTN